jgi:hypothetical protein
MPWSLLVRDAVVVLSTLGAWAVDAAVRAEGGVSAGLVALLAGALTALCGYLAHEWGHFVGARLSHSVVHLPKSARSLFLFRFDVRCNDRAQFLAMSTGGFVASTLVILLLLLVLPRPTLAGGVALTLVGLGVVATAVLEIPTFWRVLHGGPLPTGSAYVSAKEA